VKEIERAQPWTPLWQSTDEELIAAARSLDNPSPLVTELANRLQDMITQLNRLEKKYVY
jgi:hypothetical protein